MPEPPVMPHQPIIPAYGRDGAAVFWCPFCERLHWHGWPKSEVGSIEPRGSHCLPGSPLASKGYSLLIVGKLRRGALPPRCDAAGIAELNARVVQR